MPENTLPAAFPPLPAKSKAFIYASVILWLACVVFETFVQRFRPEIGYLLFAVVALTWTRYVLDPDERLRARVLTWLLVLILASFWVACRFFVVFPTGSRWSSGELLITNTLGVGLLCMWFGATGLTVLADSLGRLEAADRASVIRHGRPSLGWWLLALYLIWVGQAAYALWRMAHTNDLGF